MSLTPELSTRPFQCAIERSSALSPERLYSAWTEQLDRWFAAPGSLTMTPEVGMPFFFETQMDGIRHPHYGRFLRLEANSLIEFTWVTGDPGTKGAETVVTIEFEKEKDATKVSLAHAGFADQETMEGHRDAWPHVLDHLEKTLIK